MKFGKANEACVLNFFKEFDKLDNENKKSLKFINYYNFNFAKFLPYKGKINSRLSFLIIFLLGFFPLKKILKKDKPDYLIIHLITSLPLILLVLFNFETKFILRISGYPQMNFLRKLLWKLAFKKIYLITCPTLNTYKYIKSLNLTENNKIKVLYDPIISVKDINKKKNEKIDLKNFYLSVGRLTKQKNFMFLCKAFNYIIKENKEIKIVIAGNGEEEKKLKDFIKRNGLEKNIILLGYVDNVYPLFKHSKGFILTSLWEDPGFVLVEASYCRTPVLSSNSWPGPVELIKNDFNGIIFEKNNMVSFLDKFKNFSNYSDMDKLKLNNLKQSKKFTLFNHYKSLVQLL